MRKVMVLALIGAVGAGIAYNAEDILRYLKMRQM
jgi:hypothetical protein